MNAERRTPPAAAQLARVAGKSLLMPAVVAATRRVGAGPAPDVGGRRLLHTAQALSWGGDVALIRRDSGSFATGLSLFLGAHLAYIGAFRARAGAPVLASPARRRLVVGGGLLSAGMGLAAAGEDRRLALPVAAYGATLTSMVAHAAAVDPARGRSRLLTGATLFLVSDTLLGVRRFLAGDRGRLLEAAVLGSYTVGQWYLGAGMRAGDPRERA